MKIVQKYYYMLEEGKYTVPVKEKYKLARNLIKYPCYMFLDQATKAGICIYDSKKRLVTTLRVTKGKEDIVEFRSEFRKKLQLLIEEFKVCKIFCEDVYGGVSFDVTSKLLSIRDLIVDLAYENGIKAHPIVNTKWKARLAYPEKWDASMNDKEQIAYYVSKYYPSIKFEDDVLDAVGIAIAVLYKATNETTLRPLDMYLDKKLRVNTQIIVPDSNENTDEYIEGIIKQSKFKNKLKEKDMTVFDYDTTTDVMTNFRYVLTNYDVIAVTRIPYHRYYGQILLEYDIRPSEIPQDIELIGLSTRV